VVGREGLADDAIVLRVQRRAEAGLVVALEDPFTSGLPIASRIGRTASNAAASPPAMIESDALIAPISPPLTGASIIVAPFSPAAAASRRATTGEMLLMSMRIVPGCSALKTPLGREGAARAGRRNGESRHKSR
jgi:hypothetical protein